MKYAPEVIAAALAQLDDGPRTEIIRVRTTVKGKELVAKRAAAMGLPSSTYAHNLMMGDVHAHGSHRPAVRTGATRRPVGRPMTARRHL